MTTELHARQASHLTFKWVRKDLTAGAITGLVAIPISIGICLMSDFPVMAGLATVVCGSILGFLVSWVRPGNHTGSLGLAAGLAPILALGVASFGLSTMPFLIALAALLTALLWWRRWEVYILRLVPPFLVEGLLAGVGLRIALKFFPYTLQPINASGTLPWLAPERMAVLALSVATMGVFLWLFRRFAKTNPGLPYIVTLVIGVLVAWVIPVPMLHLENAPLSFRLPLPSPTLLDDPVRVLGIVGYVLVLTLVNVIEQVMCHVAVVKMDPQARPADGNNQLLAVWLTNLASSLFGGMTTLDNLPQSTTNTLAGAVTKLSNLATAGVVGFFIIQPQLLSYLPEFILAVLMIFSGWRMVAGLFHVISEGPYAFLLALLCAVMVFQHGMFEGLVVALVVHAITQVMLCRQQQMGVADMWRRFVGHLKATV